MVRVISIDSRGIIISSSCSGGRSSSNSGKSSRISNDILQLRQRRIEQLLNKQEIINASGRLLITDHLRSRRRRRSAGRISSSPSEIRPYRGRRDDKSATTSRMMRMMMSSMAILMVMMMRMMVAITTAVIRRRWRRIQIHKPQTSTAYFTTCVAIKRAETTY